MKRKKKLTKRERKAQNPAQTVREALAASGQYGITLMGVEPHDTLVQQVQRAMTKPAVKHLLDNPESMECAKYAQALYACLEDTAGWEFMLLVQNGDYHIALSHGDTIADLAMDGDPNKRSIFRVPRAKWVEMLGAAGGVVTYHATHKSLADALEAANFRDREVGLVARLRGQRVREVADRHEPRDGIAPPLNVAEVREDRGHSAAHEPTVIGRVGAGVE